MEELKLIVLENPFDRTSGKQKIFDYEHMNIAQIVDQYAPKNIPVIVSINGQAIHTKDYENTYPKQGDQIVMSPMLAGKGGGKSVLRIVLMIVVAIVAYWTGQWWAVNVYAKSAFFVQTAIMMIGGMLVNALVPPPKPKMPGIDNSGFDQSRAYSWNPSLTQQQGLVLPKWYGKNRIRSGNVIASHLTSIGSDQYYNALINYGYGPWKSIKYFRINEQNRDFLSGIDIVTRLGFMDQPVISHFDDTKTEYVVNTKITNTGGSYVYETIGNSFDNLEVEIGFPSGIWHLDTKTGKTVNHGVTVTLEIRKKGTSQWRTISNTDDQLTSVTTYDYRWSYGLYWTRDGIWHEYQVGSNNYDDHYEGETMPRMHPDAIGGGYWHWILTDTAITWDTTNYKVFTGSNNKVIRHIFPIDNSYIESGNKYEIRITKNSLDYDTNLYGDELWLTFVREINTDDFEYPRQVLVGVNALATDQLSGALRVDFEAETSLVRSYNTTSEQTTIATGAELGEQLLDVTSDMIAGDAGTGLSIIQATMTITNNDSTAAYATAINAISGKRYLVTGNVDLTGTKITFGGYDSGSITAGDFSFEFDASSTAVLTYSNGTNTALNDASTWNYLSVKEVLPTQVPDWEIGYSNNPAWICYDILTQPVINDLPYHIGLNDVGNPVFFLGSMKSTATGSVPQIRKLGISLVGADNYILNLRVRKITGTSWNGICYYTTSGHGESASYYKQISQPTWNADGWATIQFDMSNLTVGGTDWVDNTITSIRFDFFYGATSIVEIDYIDLGELDYRFSSDIEGWVGANTTLSWNFLPYWNQVGTLNTIEIVDYQGQLDCLHIVTGAADSGITQDIWTASTQYNISVKLWIVSGEVYLGDSGQKVGSGNYTTTGQWINIIELHTPTSATNFNIFGATSGAEFYISYGYSEATVDQTYSITRYDGFQPSQIDYAKFKEWADFCDDLLDNGAGGTDKRFTFNGTFDSETTLWDAALEVCSVSQGMLLWNGNKVSVFIDKAANAVQLFTTGNIIKDSFSETFVPKADKITELEIDFINSQKDYTRDKFTIINTDVSETNKKATLALKGITEGYQAWRLGMYKLKQSELITRIISWKADIDAIACQVGDVVNLQHNTPQWGDGGRVVSNSGTSVTLDKEITLANGKTYDFIARADDDTLISREITNNPGNYTTITVLTSITQDLTDMPYSVGEQNIETKPVRLINIKRDQDQVVTLTGVDYNSSIYNIDTNTPVLPTYNYSTIDNKTLIINNFTTTETLINVRGVVQTDLDITFEYDPAVIKQVDIYYKINSGNINFLTTVVNGEYLLRDVIDGKIYTFYLVPTNYAGWRPDKSKWQSVSHTVIGKTAPPEPLTGLELDIIDKMATFHWDLPTELDVQVGGVIEVRHTAKTGSVSWNDGFDLGVVAGTESGIKGLPLVEGTYIFRVKDSSGYTSTLVTLETGTIPSMLQFNALTTLTEDPTFSGIKTNMSVDNNVLSLVRTEPEVRGTSTGDTRVTSTGDTRVSLTASYVGTASYEFNANYYDLGSVQQSRVTAELTAAIYDITDIIDRRTILIDTWDSFDGATVSGITYKLYIRTTEDDPAGSPTWSSWREFYISDYRARAFEFKLEVTNTDSTINIDVLTLRATIDMPDRVESGESVAIPAAGSTITFAVPFKTTPAIGIAPQNMATGDYFTITSKTASSYFIRFFNSSGTGIARTADWMAKGF